MPNVTVYVSDDVWAKMQRHQGMNKSKAFAMGVNAMLAREERCRCDSCSLYLAQSAARSKVQTAVKNGTLKRQPCEACGDEKSEAHHDNYAEPLVVRWLCTQHHRDWHAENGRAPFGDLAVESRAPKRRIGAL